MTQPLGNCPGCGTDLPFEQVHSGHCPDADEAAAAGQCPEWACPECGTAVIMGTIPAGPQAPSPAPAPVPAGQSFRAA